MVKAHLWVISLWPGDTIRHQTSWFRQWNFNKFYCFHVKELDKYKSTCFQSNSTFKDLLKISVAKQVVWLAKFEAEMKEFTTVSPDGYGVFCIANQMDRTNQNAVGENCVHNDAGELSLTDEDKMKAWVEYYARLHNVEFDWLSNKLPEVPPTAGQRRWLWCLQEIKYPCLVCGRGVDSDSLLCSKCRLLVHKKCSGITKQLMDDPKLCCPSCEGKARLISGTTGTVVDVDGTMHFLLPWWYTVFVGGCHSAIAARWYVAWEKFRKLACPNHSTPLT